MKLRTASNLRTAAAVVIVAVGFATTYGMIPPAALYALPFGVMLAALLMLLPTTRLPPASTPEQSYDRGAIIRMTSFSVLLGGAILQVTQTCTALAPHVEITATQYDVLQNDLVLDPRLARLLAPAAADGRIDLHELLAFRDDARRMRERAVAREVVGTAAEAS